MNHEEMKQMACSRVQEANPRATDFDARRVYQNVLEGTVVTVSFKTVEGREDSYQVHVGRNDEVRLYRWMSDVLSEVSTSRERVWFFRFIELAGIGGVMAFILVLVFSALRVPWVYVISATASSMVGKCFLSRKNSIARRRRWLRLDTCPS